VSQLLAPEKMIKNGLLHPAVHGAARVSKAVSRSVSSPCCLDARRTAAGPPVASARKLLWTCNNRSGSIVASIASFLDGPWRMMLSPAGDAIGWKVGTVSGIVQ
jgi:hypothetical protein